MGTVKRKLSKRKKINEGLIVIPKVGLLTAQRERIDINVYNNGFLR